MNKEIVAAAVSPFRKGDIVFLQAQGGLSMEAYSKLREICAMEEERTGLKIIIIDTSLKVIGKPKETS